MSQNSSRSTVTLAARAARQLHVMAGPAGTEKCRPDTEEDGGTAVPTLWAGCTSHPGPCVGESNWQCSLSLPHGVDHVDDNFLFSLAIMADVRCWTYKLTAPGARGRAV